MIAISDKCEKSMTSALTPPQDHSIYGGLKRLLFGDITFAESEEYQEFRYKLLIVLMVSAALVTSVFILGVISQVNLLGEGHPRTMVFFTLSTLALWVWLRGNPKRFKRAAWGYEALTLIEASSALIYVSFDELRLLWFFTNVPGVFILLGIRPGWMVTILTMVGLGVGNLYLERPYSLPAMITAQMCLLYLGIFFHAYVNRSYSYFKRMRDYNNRLKDLATHDPLTGVLNARAYYEACDQQIRISQRTEQHFSVLFIDLDHFKKINDSFGHAAGDEVLRAVARVIREDLRQSDLLGRIGGEEFSVFLPGTDLSGALQVAETLRVAVEGCQIHLQDDTLRITASIGVASRDRQQLTMKAIQQRADEAMYEAKKAGRNRVSTLDARFVAQAEISSR